MIRFSKYILLFGLAMSIQTDQNISTYTKFLELQFSDHFTDLGALPNDIQQKDFSKIWTTKSLNTVEVWGGVRPEPLGFIGNEKQRLYMHFTSVEQTSNKEIYSVKGKSKVRNNICEFEGWIKINLYREFTREYFEGFDYILDPREYRTGVLVGTYEFKEDSTQKGSGTFRGRFVSSFYIDQEGEIQFGIARINSDNYRNNQFTGTWSSYSSNSSKICNWGDFRIPEAGDLDIGAGGFSPSNEYLGFGWQSYRDAFFNNDQKARLLEFTEWWKN